MLFIYADFPTKILNEHGHGNVKTLNTERILINHLTHTEFFLMRTILI